MRAGSALGARGRLFPQTHRPELAGEVRRGRGFPGLGGAWGAKIQKNKLGVSGSPQSLEVGLPEREGLRGRDFLRKTGSRVRGRGEGMGPLRK